MLNATFVLKSREPAILPMKIYFSFKNVNFSERTIL